jgi:hypothetical protein
VKITLRLSSGILAMLPMELNTTAVSYGKNLTRS